MKILNRGFLIALALGVAAGCGNKTSTPSSAPDRSRASVTSAPLPQYVAQASVASTPSASGPLLTAVDPYANAVSSADGLKPARPFWYAVDRDGLSIFRLDDNTLVYRVTWPAQVDVALPVGEGAFQTISKPTAGWDPVGMLVTYPTEEQLASTSETPSTYVFVVMAHSGYQWASNPAPPDLRDPNLRDEMVPASPETESSLLLEVDVTDPSFSPDTNPTGPMFAAALLGHHAGQPAFDPATGNIYVPNMPSLSLPTAPADLTSFVSVIMPIAMAEGAAAEPASGAPADAPLVLCGPEHPDEGMAGGVPYVWPCMAEGGENELLWEFQNLPDWLFPHHDKLTGELDGILYGTPPASGTWTFQARVSDLGENPGVDPPNTSEWTSVTLNVSPSGPLPEPEAGWEAGVAGGQGVAGSGSCEAVPTATPGAILPAWVDVQPAYLNGALVGCYVMGTAPVSGEAYEFALPNFHFASPFEALPVVFKGSVMGTYGFDPLPPGVGLSGLAWHEIDKIHDPSTEADILNGEFIGVEPYTGQLYQLLLPQGSIEVNEGSGPPELATEADELRAVGAPLLGTLSGRLDIANLLAENPGFQVRFGDLAVEASADPRIFVTASQLEDPTGANPVVIPIGGASGAATETGALVKVSGTRSVAEPSEFTISTTEVVDLLGVQALRLGLDSNLSPGIRGSEPGQVDNGVLWVTGPASGSAAVVDTELGAMVQTLPVTGATALGGISVDYGTRSAYIASLGLQSVNVYGTGGAPRPRAPSIWTAPTMTFTEGVSGSFTLVATGWPEPVLGLEGALPTGLTFTDNGNGTATVSGAPAVGTGNDYQLTFTATNGVLPNATFAVILTVVSPPTITSGNAATFTEGSPGTFTVTTQGSVTLLYISVEGTLPEGVTFTENGDGTATLGGTPAAGTAGPWVFNIRASTGTPPDAVQEFTLTINPPIPSAPAITSGSSTSFNVGQLGTFTVTTSGYPLPTLSESGALPGGVTFTPNANGTATLSGTPVVNSGGTYTLTFTATNSEGTASQTFILNVVAGPAGVAPSFTSGTATTFTVGTPGSFTVSATGSPPPTFFVGGGLPSGVTFTNNGNGTATLAGTPAAGTQGTYALSLTATNGVSPNAAQSFTLTIQAQAGTAPQITSANAATFTVGEAGTFSVTTTGTPTPNLSYWGTLPAGVSFVNNGNGTATLTGTPATGSQGSYGITFSAANGVGTNALQNFILTVQAPAGTAPVILSTNSATFTVGDAGSFLVSASGLPTPALSMWGTLPAGVTFTDLGNGTASLAGTPAAGTAGTYLFTVTAANGVLPNATQYFTLFVNPPPGIAPSITSGNSTTFTVGSAGSFLVTATGTPVPSLSVSGALPNGVTFTDNHDGTATLAGTPTSSGTWAFTVNASNGVTPNASQNFTLTVNAAVQALVITTTTLPAATVGTDYSATLAATGGTAPYTWSAPRGALPNGIRLSSTGVLSGNPRSAGTFTFTVQVRDSASQSATQNLTLTVNPRPPRNR